MEEANSIATFLKDVGIVNWLFSIAFVGVVYYFPKIVQRHFESIDKAHIRFTNNLETISTKFVGSLDKISSEHDKHFAKLLDIHSDVKDLKNKK